ncbi:HEAT repeat domain-containing protein [filamentous cyanobacterium LEGE 11480]|uniref:HEAT repeat domain-containing protein n=1 Tax=Romeriopsis navalis LEGE 11480 TaxID=2777977 RepID=A0A928VPH6_9CYAN|nr:HEAT repeat domain-containing protein [Romeriopsis navalis]MBE9032100.1 HEAT repeat domain-containing protein [Romeriopsis navalis LEGE 11480]
MELNAIAEHLDSENPQDRMRGITALREYEPEVAVPLLMRCVDDSEVMIRSFVAMGLGYKQTPAAYEKLLTMVADEADPNIRAEAANSLGKYGQVAIPHLVKAFHSNLNWLMRLSIIPALARLDAPAELMNLCQAGLRDADVTVKETAITYLMDFAKGPQSDEALTLLLSYADSEHWNLRRQVALVLKSFEQDQAQETLMQLRQDPDHRVVAAALEALV